MPSSKDKGKKLTLSLTKFVDLLKKYSYFLVSTFCVGNDVKFVEVRTPIFQKTFIILIPPKFKMVCNTDSFKRLDLCESKNSNQRQHSFLVDVKGHLMDCDLLALSSTYLSVLRNNGEYTSYKIGTPGSFDFTDLADDDLEEGEIDEVEKIVKDTKKMMTDLDLSDLEEDDDVSEGEDKNDDSEGEGGDVLSSAALKEMSVVPPAVSKKGKKATEIEFADDEGAPIGEEVELLETEFDRDEGAEEVEESPTKGPEEDEETEDEEEGSYGDDEVSDTVFIDDENGVDDEEGEDEEGVNGEGETKEEEEDDVAEEKEPSPPPKRTTRSAVKKHFNDADSDVSEVDSEGEGDVSENDERTTIDAVEKRPQKRPHTDNSLPPNIEETDLGIGIVYVCIELGSFYKKVVGRLEDEIMSCYNTLDDNENDMRDDRSTKIADLAMKLAEKVKISMELCKREELDLKTKLLKLSHILIKINALKAKVELNPTKYVKAKPDIDRLHTQTRTTLFEINVDILRVRDAANEMLEYFRISLESMLALGSN
jgi:hypothetical protein